MVGMLPNSRVTYLDKSALVNIRPAGQPVEWDIGTKECLDFPVPNETPAENQRFRYERKFPVGASSVHPSTVKDVLPDGPFGRKNVKEAGDDTATAIKPYPQFAGGQQLLEFNEAKYDRNIREPLGKAYNRGHVIPEEIATQRGFGLIYGSKQIQEERRGLKTIFPENPVVDPDLDPEVHKLYVASHNEYAPGEARNRGYDWQRTGVDPKTHAFGYFPDRIHDGVRKALNPATDPKVVPAPKIVPAHHEQHKMETYEALGKPKFRGTVGVFIPPDMAFGKPSLKELQPSAGQLIASWPKEAIQPDADLGKSLRPGFRNEWHDPNRVFGLPSIRTDVPVPKLVTIANTVNYGEEADARHLLFPARATHMGITESHYLAPQSKESIKEYLARANIKVSDDECDAIFSMASEHDGTPGAACMETFMRARHMMIARALGL